MDCRKPLALLFGVWCGVSGCQLSQTTPPAPPTPAPPPAATPRPATTEKLRTPKPDTCVAAGVAFESEANDPRCEPTARERLRDQARKAYRQALDIDPNCLSAYARLAAFQSSVGENEAAIATCQKGLQRFPREAALWHGLGMTQARMKDWNSATAALGKAVELDPDNRAYATSYGHCLARAGRIEEALVCFRRTVGEAKAQYNVARMMHHLKQPERARQHLALALQADPNLTPAQQLLAALDGRTPEPGGAVPAHFETLAEEGSR